MAKGYLKRRTKDQCVHEDVGKIDQTAAENEHLKLPSGRALHTTDGRAEVDAVIPLYSLT